MKAERLDQILLRHGYVTNDEIKQALKRQKTHGGRIGSHLLHFKFITEEQLVAVLSEQHKVPGFHLARHDISKAIVKKLPAELAREYLALPFDEDPEAGVLIAVADPGDATMIAKVKKALGASKIVLYVAPESLLRIVIDQYYRRRKRSSSKTGAAEKTGGGTPERAAKPSRKKTAPIKDQKNVLMISKAMPPRHLLGPLFQHEGYYLKVLSNPEEIKSALQKKSFDHVLVSQEMLDEFSSWVRSGKIPTLQVEVSAFGNVSKALLENPVPYKRIIRSLFRSLQITAESRCAETSWTPPYVVICNDIQKLARSFGFRRLATDGLQIAAYLLVPRNGTKSAERNRTPEPHDLTFDDFNKSLELARSLHFPWPVARVMQTFLRLLSEGNRSEQLDDSNQEMMLAAQILALVWFHRVALRGIECSSEDVATAVGSRLRHEARRLAGPEVVETYIRLLEHNNEEVETGTYNEIFIVSKADDISEQFATSLKSAGFHVVDIDDMGEAQRMCERRPPAAILVDHKSYPDHISNAGRLFKLNSVVLLYAFTRENDPSLTLDLLDSGFDDVYTPPYDFDVITGRISKSLRGISQSESKNEKPGGFSATFKAFSFIDLLQSLGQSLKTVHIHLVRGSGEQADIYMRKGRMVYASSGNLKGAEVVYHVIGWGENGAFSVEPDDHTPEDNIFEANEAILMEGCRLLDESRI